jgi:hypothetical protein
MNKSLKKELINEIKQYDDILTENEIEIIDNLLIQAYRIIKSKTLSKSGKSLTENQLYLQYEIQ